MLLLLLSSVAVSVSLSGGLAWRYANQAQILNDNQTRLTFVRTPTMDDEPQWRPSSCRLVIISINNLWPHKENTQHLWEVITLSSRMLATNS